MMFVTPGVDFFKSEKVQQYSNNIAIQSQISLAKVDFTIRRQDGKN